MRALHVPAAGERPQLSDLPVPEPGEGQVLIRVKAAGLNAIDNGIAAGMMAEMMEHAYPLVLGRDAAGVVAATGPGVTGIAVGEEVFGHVLLAPPIQVGTLAEYAVLATGTPADTERLTGLGAATVLDYTTAPVADQVRAAYPGGIDALIDLVSYAPDDLPLTALRKGGKVASSLGAASDEALAADGLTGSNIMAMPTREVIAALAGQVADGTLKVDVETILPLANAADGLATLASGAARGKIVVQVGS